METAEKLQEQMLQANSSASSTASSAARNQRPVNKLRTNKLSHGHSRDEMNLAEFPLAVLSSRTDPSVKTLEFRDTQRLRTGETITREWIVTGADKFGLPTSTDDDVVLGLIRLTMDRGFRERKVFFSRYELLRALRWSTEGRSYSRLTKSLDRLSGVRIRATNSFFDNSSKQYQTCNFGVIDAYEINDSRGAQKQEPAAQSFFIWSEALFESFCAGFIKKLDMDLYFSLQSAVSRRLYRYLDKHFYYRPVVEKPLMDFAFEKLGLSRTYRFVSSVKQQIEPAAAELVEVGFLDSYEMLGKGQATTIRFVAKSEGKHDAESTAEPEIIPAEVKRSFSIPVSLVTATPAVTQPNIESPVGEQQLYRELMEALISRGISYVQAIRLLSRKSLHELEKIEAIVRYYDALVEKGDHKVSRNRVGFLYRAVESPARFILPEAFEVVGHDTNRKGKSGPRLSSGQQDFGFGRTPGNQQSNQNQGSFQGVFKGIANAGRQTRPELKVFRAKDSEPKKAPPQDPLKQQYNSYVDTQIDEYRKCMSREETEQVAQEVEERMACFRKLLDPAKFQAAWESCFRDQILRRINVLDFTAWKPAVSENRGSENGKPENSNKH